MWATNRPRLSAARVSQPRLESRQLLSRVSRVRSVRVASTVVACKQGSLCSSRVNGRRVASRHTSRRAQAAVFARFEPLLALMDVHTSSSASKASSARLSSSLAVLARRSSRSSLAAVARYSPSRLPLSPEMYVGPPMLLMNCSDSSRASAASASASPSCAARKRTSCEQGGHAGHAGRTRGHAVAVGSSSRCEDGHSLLGHS